MPRRQGGLEITGTSVPKTGEGTCSSSALLAPDPSAATGRAGNESWRRRELVRFAAGAIAADKAAAGAEDRAAAETQKRIDDYRNRWRCPAGLTYEECERQQNATRDIHLRERQEFRGRLGQLEAELARHQRQAAGYRQSAEAREARLAAGRDARARDLEVRVKAAEQGKEAADALAKEQATFRDRLSRFNEEDEAVRRLRATIKDMEQVLARLQLPSK